MLLEVETVHELEGAWWAFAAHRIAPSEEEMRMWEEDTPPQLRCQKAHKAIDLT